MTNEAFARVRIDQLLRDAGWPLIDGRSVRYEYPLDDGGKADYVLFDRLGRALAVLEAKSTSVNLGEGEAQGQRYASQLRVPYIFLSNGEEVWFRDTGQDAHFRPVATVFSQDDLTRRKAAREIRRNPLDIAIDPRIVERLYQTNCIDTLCREIVTGRRKLLVEMATGTGKTRTAAALLKRLFDANWATRALFVVDRNTLGIQAEDAFSEHLPHLPTYRVPRTGRRFQDEKRITIVTLQTLVNEYEKYSSGYFDLIVIDECHRSIYGQWRRALDHFDGIKVGMTATPCVMRDAPDVDEDDRVAIRDTLRFFELDRPTFTYTLPEAIADGHLVPYEIYRAMTARTAATEGFAVARDEIDWQALDEATRAELEELFADQNPLVVDPTALERRFTIPERNRAMVREFRAVLEQGYTGPNGVRRAPDWGKTIVFAVTKRHAETLARLFDEVFADKKPAPMVRYADFVISGMGADDTVDGQAKIKRFKREPFPQILVSVNMLDTGFDCPDVRNLVMARFTHSSILYGDKLNAAQWRKLQAGTFYGNDVDPKMISLASMNLALRGLPDVRILKRNVLTTSFDRQEKAEKGLPLDGYDVILANPPFSGRIDKDRIVDDVKIGATTATELLFVRYMIDNLKEGGRCGVIVPEGVLFGSTGAHKELRRMLMQNNRVEAVLSLPGGVFQPYSGVKTSVLVFTRGRRTDRVMFLHASNDGFKLDANHDQPIEADDLPGLIDAFANRDKHWKDWKTRDSEKPWTYNWWFADAAAIEREDWNLSASRYRPETRETTEHRDPRKLLGELQEEVTAILSDIDALASELRERTA